VSGYLPAVGAKEIEPLELVDRATQAASETREGPDDLRRKIWRDESGAEIWVHLTGDAPHTTTVLFRSDGRVTGHLVGFSPPVDGPLNGQMMLTHPEPALAPRLVLDLAEFGDAVSQFCAGRRAGVGVAALLTEGRLFADRAAYLAACSRRGGEAPAVSLQPVGLQPQGNSPAALLGGTVARVDERRNTLTGETFLVLRVEWDGMTLEVAASLSDLAGVSAAPGAYLAGKVWLVGFDLRYATVVPADPQAFPLPPGTVAAFTGWNGYLQLLQVTRLEPMEPAGLVVHIRIFAELFDSLESLKAHPGERQLAVTHLPVEAGALLDSDIMPLGAAALVGVDEAAHSAWHEAAARGEAGAFGIPMAQIIQWLANNQPPVDPGEGDPTAAEAPLSAG
jgi:hypothetical protein